ncbi:VOC family protein [Spirillospora sp. CA-253888]
MSPVVRHLMIDCVGSPHALALFWGQALGRPVQGAAQGCFVELDEDASGLSLFFQQSSGPQPAQGRLHLHLNPVEQTLAAEVERLTKLGATVVSSHAHARGSELGWVVLADPEGNEFCVDSSDAEVSAFQDRHRISKA